MCLAHRIWIHLAKESYHIGELSSATKQYTHHVTHSPVMQARRLHTASQYCTMHHGCVAESEFGAAQVEHCTGCSMIRTRTSNRWWNAHHEHTTVHWRLPCHSAKQSVPVQLCDISTAICRSYIAFLTDWAPTVFILKLAILLVVNMKTLHTGIVPVVQFTLLGENSIWRLNSQRCSQQT